MITESVRKPDCCPSGVASATNTRLGCPARERLLVIIATVVWGRPVFRLSAWTTKTGRGFEVRRLESGNRAKTISPRLKVIVDIHIRAVPVLGNRLEPPTQLRSLGRVDPPRAKIDRTTCWQESHNDPSFLDSGR